MTDEMLDGKLPVLREAAEEVSRKLGYWMKQNT